MADEPIPDIDPVVREVLSPLYPDDLGDGPITTKPIPLGKKRCHDCFSVLIDYAFEPQRFPRAPGLAHLAEVRFKQGGRVLLLCSQHAALRVTRKEPE